MTGILILTNYRYLWVFMNGLPSFVFFAAMPFTQAAWCSLVPLFSKGCTTVLVSTATHGSRSLRLYSSFGNLGKITNCCQQMLIKVSDLWWFIHKDTVYPHPFGFSSEDMGTARIGHHRPSPTNSGFHIAKIRISIRKTGLFLICTVLLGFTIMRSPTILAHVSSKVPRVHAPFDSHPNPSISAARGHLPSFVTRPIP